MKTNFNWHLLRWFCEVVKTLTGIVGVLSFGFIRFEYLDLKAMSFYLNYTEKINLSK